MPEHQQWRGLCFKLIPLRKHEGRVAERGRPSCVGLFGFRHGLENSAVCFRGQQFFLFERPPPNRSRIRLCRLRDGKE